MDLIPEARREAVAEAFKATFDKRAPSALSPISGGASGALICSFEVGDRPYVLRIEPERVALPDRTRGFRSMAAAAAAGAAPRVHHADPATGVAIMDFVATRPLSTYPGGATALAGALGALIATVRSAPLFPGQGDYPGAIASLLEDVSRSPLLAPGDLAPHADGLAMIRSLLTWDFAALVSSHNDPNPRNMLFDGERLWLVDWELASANDPLVDLAILSTDLAEGPDLEDALLTSALGTAPDARLRARLHVIRLLSRLFYGCVVFDSFGDRRQPFPPATGSAHTPATFRAAIAEGRLASGAPETAYAFARMSLAAFLDGVRAPGFQDVLKRAEQG